MGSLLPNVETALYVYAIILGAVALRYFWKRRSVSYLRGPPNPSWLVGHTWDLRYEEDVGDLQFSWFREYGTIHLINGCFGENILDIADPKAMQYIFHTSAYNFPKTDENTHFTKDLFGNGIVAVTGGTHQRHRKVMLPAFSVPQLRTFLGIFQQYSSRLGERLKVQIARGDDVVNLSAWLSKLTLDVIGQTAFQYDFQALDDGDNAFLKEVNSLFLDSNMNSTYRELMHAHLWRWLPGWMMEAYNWIRPNRTSKRFRHFQDTSAKIGYQLIKEQTAPGASVDQTSKDVLSVLIRANLAEDPTQKLSDEEVVAQVSTLIIAGHDTTANTVTWILWELAKSPKDQTRLREEIAAMRAKKAGDAAFTSTDYDNMQFLNAIIKEGLRLHPIVPNLARKAGKDDIIPLSESVTTKDGRVIHEVPVSKGQSLMLCLAGYNRLPSVWGEDADLWRPDRFIKAEKAQINVGIVANLMSFSAGLKGCIGWRFSYMEMQAILVELIETFEFAIPPGGIDIRRLPIGLMVPLLRNEPRKGVQMPLKMTLVGA